MKKGNGAEILIDALKNEGAEVVFGYPGGAVLTLYDQLFRSSLKHILVRHEQAAVHAADGYARVTGRPGVVFATSGPGATNLVTGIANAYLDSIPLVLITGQVPSRFIGTDAFQEANITGITKQITKQNYQVKNAEELTGIISEAFYLATTGRTRPVLIDIPKDIFDQNTSINSGSKEVFIESDQPPAYNEFQVKQAVEAIRMSKRPVIFGGGGLIRAKAAETLTIFAEKFKTPVTLSLMGLGAYPGDRDLFLGMPGMHGSIAANYALSEADLIVAAGVRFNDRVTGKLENFASNAKIIHIDIDSTEIGKNVSVDIPVLGDVKAVLDCFLKELQPGDTGEWINKVRDWRNCHPIPVGRSGTGVSLRPQFVIRELSRLSSKNVVVATDVGQHQMWAAQHFIVREPGTFLTSGGLGTMGYGFPAAIGAKIAAPGREVICITGDGSFQMNIQELATAVHNQLDITIAVINNGCLGMVRQWQEIFYNKRYSTSVLECNPDFVRVAEAYGAKGMRVKDECEVVAAIEKAKKVRGPVLIDFIVAPEENVYPMVAPNCAIDDIIIGDES
jgi:acetolactate synthase I/II/III large subunit